MIDTTEAVRLAAEAIHWTPLDATRARRDPAHTPPDPSGWEERAADAAVTAALPALAEQFAALIEAERDRIRTQYDSWLHVHMGAVEPGSRDYESEVAMDALDTAARIAEGRTT